MAARPITRTPTRSRNGTRSITSTSGRRPMLVITGEKDFRIPYTQGLAAFTALQRREIPSRLLVFPNENHWVLKPKNSRQWYGEVLGLAGQVDRGGIAAAKPLDPAGLTAGCGGAAPAKGRGMTELPKTFDPAAIESRWYRIGRRTACSAPSGPARSRGRSSTRRPTSPAALHIGHALDNTLQDILVRHARLKGKDALLGGRHRPCRHRHADGGRAPAGTRSSRSAPTSPARNSSRRSGSGRKRAAARSRGSSAGSAARWTGRTSASRWTRASRRPCSRCSSICIAQGLLYRDKRLVNWDPGLGTAISDLEVETREVQGKFWHLALSAGGRQRRDHRVATTRPETMLADMAVAVNPDGRALHGADRQAGAAADHRPADPDRHRRACRSRTRLGRGEDHAGA